VTRHTAILGDGLSLAPAKRTAAFFGLPALGFHPFPLVGLLALGSAEVPPIIGLAILARESLPAPSRAHTLGI
jgi:hypothetical protein